MNISPFLLLISFDSLGLGKLVRIKKNFVLLMLV
jgi:hypothetical protein